MSMPPMMSRILRWQDRRRVITDTALAVGLLILAVLTGMAPSSSDGAMPGRELWIPVAVVAVAVETIALCLRQSKPLAAWIALSLTPALHDLVIHYGIGLHATRPFALTNGQAVYVMLGTPMCLAALAIRSRLSWAWTAEVVSPLPLVVTGMVTGLLPTGRGAPYPLVYGVLLYGLILLPNVVAVLVGTVIRFQQARLYEAEMRSVRLALAHEQAALLAAANERGRIAREMHDVVAHSLAVMIAMADGAAATIDSSPETAKEALEMLSETGRSALADTRRLVGVLREDPGASSAPTLPVRSSSSPAVADDAAEGPVPRTGRPGADGPKSGSPHSPGEAPPVVRDLPVPEFAPPGTVVPAEPSEKIADLRRQATDASADASAGDLPTAPAPEQADLAVLVARFESAGIPVSYRWNGRPLPDDKGLQLTVFRIAQEALTNVLRYAPTTRAVTVSVERHVGTAVLTVDNEAAPGSTPVHGSGKGLIGMRERAAVYGGTVQAGPTASGWRVRAVLRWDEDEEGTSPWQIPL